MKNLEEDSFLMRCDLKNEMKEVKKFLSKKLIKGEKYSLKRKGSNKMQVFIENNEFLCMSGFDNCMLTFKTNSGYKINILIKDICLGFIVIKDKKGEILLK